MQDAEASAESLRKVPIEVLPDVIAWHQAMLRLLLQQVQERRREFEIRLDRLDTGPALTPQEKKIAHYLIHTHLSASEIAGTLYVSLNTAKTHIRNLYRKLGVRSRRELCAQWHSRGVDFIGIDAGGRDLPQMQASGIARTGDTYPRWG
jgi:DNA-binding CsgD family transcriptional regulator